MLGEIVTEIVPSGVGFWDSCMVDVVGIGVMELVAVVAVTVGIVSGDVLKQVNTKGLHQVIKLGISTMRNTTIKEILHG